MCSPDGVHAHATGRCSSSMDMVQGSTFLKASSHRSRIISFKSCASSGWTRHNVMHNTNTTLAHNTCVTHHCVADINTDKDNRSSPAGYALLTRVRSALESVRTSQWVTAHTVAECISEYTRLTSPNTSPPLRVPTLVVPSKICGEWKYIVKIAESSTTQCGHTLTYCTYAQTSIKPF